MIYLNKDMWHLNTEDQYKVDQRATEKSYDFYTHSGTGRVYFAKRKQAEKVAKFMDLDPVDDVYHTSHSFAVDL